MPDARDLPHVAEPGEMIAPARTALLVIDVQVDFAAPTGAIGRTSADISMAEAAVARIEALITAARGASVPVAFTRVVTRPETDPQALTTWMERRGTPGEGAICRAGGGGADYWRVAPQPGEIEIEKLVYSSFHGTDLDARLRARGVDTLVVTGVSTDCCVDSTVRDAFHRDYHVFVVSDACATYDGALHVASLNVLQMHCALLVTSDAVIGAWQRPWTGADGSGRVHAPSLIFEEPGRQ